MSDAFQDRKKSFEAKYKQDQELEFKVSARRNKLFGEWLAGELGIQGDGISAYAKEVILADLDEPGDEDVIRKVIADIVASNVEITEEAVREKLSEMEALARTQLLGESTES
ncbi:MAG: aldolase [Magnetovibrio sp.]|nr:aldolase [Magnetovibrio sp.]|tara:strand:+ start:1057 stop:1392 length:336 start_codon:yes stop_codon:yes gene_type:complete